MLLTFPITQKRHLNSFHVEQLLNDRPGERFSCDEMRSQDFQHFHSTSRTSKTSSNRFISHYINMLNQIFVHWLSLHCLSKLFKSLWSHLASGYCLFWFFKPTCNKKHDCTNRNKKKYEKSFKMCQIIWAKSETEKSVFTFDDWKWLLAPKQESAGRKFIVEFIKTKF